MRTAAAVDLQHVRDDRKRQFSFINLFSLVSRLDIFGQRVSRAWMKNSPSKHVKEMGFLLCERQKRLIGAIDEATVSTIENDEAFFDIFSRIPRDDYR